MDKGYEQGVYRKVNTTDLQAHAEVLKLISE